MKVGCFHCDARMSVGESFCPRCGHPTPFASYEERQRWEVQQWRGSHPGAQARVHAATMTVPRRLETVVVPEAQPSRPVQPVSKTVEFPRIGALRPAAPPERAPHAPEPSASSIDQLTRIVEVLQEMSGRIDALAGRLEEMRPRRTRIRERVRRS